MKNFDVENILRTSSVSIFYYASFYPYAEPDKPQIFATVGDRTIVIASCGMTPEVSDTNLEVLATYQDDDPKESLCSVCWTRDVPTGRPWLAVGGKTGTVKVIDCSTGRLVCALNGHGDEILDLQACPTHPHIIASTSGDHTIRIWNLDPEYKQDPCAIICAGGGHREQVLTVAFHDSGRFLISGGMDNQVHLWALPNLSNLPMKRDEPMVLFWSHFSTNALHSNYVDSVAFYGDLVLSRAAKENKIVLWRIDGFDSSLADNLSQANAPTNHDKQRDTMSAFGEGFTRLLQFSISNTAPWYMRFGKISGHEKYPPLLAMGSDAAKVYIFDFQRLELDDTVAHDAVVAQDNSDDSDIKFEDARPTTPLRVDDDTDYVVESEDGEGNELERPLFEISRKRRRRKSQRPYAGAKDVKRRRNRRKRYQHDKIATAEAAAVTATATATKGSDVTMSIEVEDTEYDIVQHEGDEFEPSQSVTAKKNIRSPTESESEPAESEYMTSTSRDELHETNQLAGDVEVEMTVDDDSATNVVLTTEDIKLASSDSEITTSSESALMQQREAMIKYLDSAWQVVDDYLADVYPAKPVITTQTGPVSRSTSGNSSVDFVVEIVPNETTATSKSLAQSTSQQLRVMSTQELLEHATSLASSKKPTIYVGEGSSTIADPFQDIRPHVTLDIPKSRRLVRHLAFSPNGKHLVAVGDGGSICVWGVH
ncbi:WD40-repeat-containing domain protein [Lipomyces arxii]|uniref:WD40-repeat-containing domain protein n=1 Tax=Lipomyces arxii TaxID=56418 RepID=UPI0034CF3757